MNAQSTSRLVRRLFNTAIATLLVLGATHTALATLIVDQQNTSSDNSLGEESVFPPGPTIGQSFTAGLPLMNFATFSLVVSQPIFCHVSLRLGDGLSGTVLGSSTSLQVTDPSAHTVEFDFAAPISLTLGTVYTLQIVTDSVVGPPSVQLIGLASDANPYLNGSAYLSSGNFSAYDFVFSEGINTDLLVPEPGTVSLLGFGALGLACARFFAHRKV